jgi:hypothetical protein
MRKCDGSDVTLVKVIDIDNEEPCDCGLEFDDVFYSVLYPHARIPSREEKLMHDNSTMLKVYNALISNGFTHGHAMDAINAMQNSGIYFRELK